MSLSTPFDLEKELKMPIFTAFNMINMEELNNFRLINGLKDEYYKEKEIEELEGRHELNCYIAGLHQVALFFVQNLIDEGIISETLILEKRQNFENHTPENVIANVKDENVIIDNDGEENYSLKDVLLDSLKVSQMTFSQSYLNKDLVNAFRSNIPSVTCGLGLAIELIESVYEQELILPPHEANVVLDAACAMKDFSENAKIKDDTEVLHNIKLMGWSVTEYFVNNKIANIFPNASHMDRISKYDDMRERANEIWFNNKYPELGLELNYN